MKSLEQVENFWNDNLCGQHFITARYPSEEFFSQYRNFRYTKTHHLDTYIDWKGAVDKDVLEIGLGVGADGTRWAEHARSYTGIDLTDEAVIATQKHLEVLGLPGQTRKGNAEALELPDDSFDIVYSHGVLHHTSNIEKTFDEVYRVLRPGGQFIVMLYCKHSFNYWIRIQTYFRIRFLWALCMSQIGGKPGSPWREHLANFREKGWSYFSWSEWPHHCTDGPDCEIANIYTPARIKAMLRRAGFTVKKTKQAHFPAGLSPGLERSLAAWIGFHHISWAVKS